MHPQIMALAAARCAPVQAVTWGHPVTTGLPSMDAFLSSEAMEPPDGDKHYTERLVRLPGLSLALEPLPQPDRSPEEVAALRASFGLPERGLLLLCAQSWFKLLPENDAIFAEILSACPSAHLAILGTDSGMDRDLVPARLRAAMRARGVDPGRLSVVGTCPHGRFLELNACADVFLDGLSWSGGQTTLEAVACGLLPVCTEGRWMRTRHTAAILREIGLPELVAPSPAGVVPILQRLHDDPARLGELRARLRAGRDRLRRDARAIPALEAWITSSVAAARADRAR
jgi:predicted O-linked N-acetylglucosamine transferase (SPINDLY family)